MAPLPYLERVKIQSEILLPFYRRVKSGLGEARAAELLRAAVREYAADLGAGAGRQAVGTSLDKLLSLNVRGCRYAEYFRALGELEFGAMVTCEIDPPMTSASGADLGLERMGAIATSSGR